MSMRGWSGALPNETQSIPTLEDARGAICQVRRPERNKEEIDDHPLSVSPCILYTPVYLMQECEIKLCKNLPVLFKRVPYFLSNVTSCSRIRQTKF